MPPGKGMALLLAEDDGEDEGLKQEVITDLQDAGLKCEDWDLLLSALRRWCSSPSEDYEDDMPEDDEGDDGGLAAKLRK